MRKAIFFNIFLFSNLLINSLIYLIGCQLNRVYGRSGLQIDFWVGCGYDLLARKLKKK